jgi:Ca-activated chloride channel family protein
MSVSAITDSPAASGLFRSDRRAPVPLDHVRVEAHLVDAAARVTIRQSYRNAEEGPIEVVYTFPLDEGAAVCGFEATVDGVRYVGKALARDEAFKQYDDALEAGHGGYLLDEERADVFTASLGNVRPGATVELVITYVTELAAEGEAVRFSLPTTVSPRYAPADDRQGVGPTPAEVLNPPVAFEVPYGFSFEMDVVMSGAIRRVQSPSHPVEVALDGSRATVRLAQRAAAMDRDLVIVIAADGLSSPHAVVERGPNGGAVLLSFLPQLGSKAGAAELIFVVDRSGSMGGTSIEEVRNALQLCLRSLTPGSHFNIVSFGSTCAPLFGASRPYDEASLAEAAAFVAAMDADMGGTEILPALQFAVQQPALAGLPRQVLVLTDGEVTNTDEVVDLARRHAASARCFTFGIGAGASHHLVKGLARASRGAAEFISPGERIEAKVMRQFKRVFAPAITDVTVDWGQTGVTTASGRVPPVFDGERLRVYALAESIGTGSATLRGLVAGQPVAFDVPIDPAEAAEGDTIATLAARERIRALEEQGDYLESRGSRQRRARAAHAAAVEIAALGVKYQLASRETSFVAVEHRDAPVEGRAELRRVPVALTSGWGGLRETGVHYLYAPQMAFASLPAVLPTPGGPGSARGLVWSFPGQDMPQPGDERLEADDAIACSLEAPGHGPRPWRASPPRSYDQRVTAPRERARRPLDVLVSLQRADGSWDLAAEFATAVSVTLRRLEKELRNATGDPGTIRRALATAMALAWLEKHAASQRMEWELLADKAQAWLEASHTEPAPGAGWHAWLDLAQRLA